MKTDIIGDKNRLTENVLTNHQASPVSIKVNLPFRS